MGQTRIKLLHVEDDDIDAYLMQELLLQNPDQYRYDITRRVSLGGALKCLNNEEFDAVLLDMHLTDIEGIDNVKAIKEQNPDIPVIVLSGVDNDTYALETIDHGAQEFLVKGYCNSKVLQRCVQTSIRRKLIERKLFQQANFDDVTGLPNRRLFQEYVNAALVKAQRWKRQEALLFLDIDNFKTINEQYGYKVGNDVLKETAVRMASHIRRSDIIARYGADEFVVLLDNQGKDVRDAAVMAATKLLYAFQEPYMHSVRDIKIDVSLGIAIYPEHGEEFTLLMGKADSAMLKAKKRDQLKYEFAA